MFKCLPRDADVVIWAYTVEMLNLREGLPEKQSVKRGMATWASAVVNEKTKRERRKREGNDMVEGDRCDDGREREDAALTAERRRVDKLVELCFFIYYVTNSNTLSILICSLLIDRPPSLLLSVPVPYNHSPTLVVSHAPLLDVPQPRSPVRRRCPRSVQAPPTH